MTKNELTRLLGIDALMKKNAKSKAFNTMLDILCDFLVITKEATHGSGVQFPRSGGTHRESEKPDRDKKAPYETNSKAPRPQTSSGTAGGARTQANFFNPNTLSAKPQPLINAFQSGSNADISV